MKRFNIRVYGVLLDSEQGVLVTDEERFGMKFTKFPGGGLEFGEGIKDCLLREYEEELNQKIEVVDHFYTTDYFQQSAFNKNDQLISVYYLVKPVGEYAFKISSASFDFDPSESEEPQSFRFIPVENLSENDFTFPVDKLVAKMIRSKFAS